MLFDLIKKAYELKEEEKLYLNKNLYKVMSILDEDSDFQYNRALEDVASGEHSLFILQKVSEKKKKKRPFVSDIRDESSDPAEGERMNDPYSFNSVNPHASSKKIIKTSNTNKTYLSGDLNDSMFKVANLYDPETPQQMLNLISLMEKFASIDDDFSHDNICVFLYPLSRGAKRFSMRPAKIVGLTKELWVLSRQFDRLKNSKNDNIDTEGSMTRDSSIDSIKNDFIDRLALIKNKIANIMKNKLDINDNKKPLDAEPLIVDNESLGAKLAFKKKIEALKKKGWSNEAISELKSSLLYKDSFYKNF